MVINPVKQSSRRQRVFSVLTSALFIVCLGVLFAFVGKKLWFYFRNPEELRLLIKTWGVWAPLGIIVLQLVQIVVAPLPGNLMAFVSGYALGFWPTLVWLICGVLGGAAVAFSIARFSGRRLLRVFVPEEALARLDRLVVKRGIFYIFLLLLIPNPLGDWVYYLAGLTGMRLPLFLLLVFFARLPSNAIECGLGAQAIRFGLTEWIVLGLLVVTLSVAYFLNQKRVERFLERLAHPRERI